MNGAKIAKNVSYVLITIFALLLFDKISSKKFVRIFIKREYKRQKGIK